MTIKLNSLARWHDLEAGKAILFEKGSSNGERRIRLNLNLAGQTAFYIENEKGPRFLAVAGPGLETLEFSVAGTVGVFADEGSGPVQYQTSETEPTHAEVVDAAIFTKIANRRHRNPELEEVMYRMQMNMERRLAQQAGEIEAAFERRRNEEANGRPVEKVISNAPGATPQGEGGNLVPPQEPVVPEPGEASGGDNNVEQSSG